MHRLIGPLLELDPSMNRIRLVTFDALHTVITPRLPIYVQYSQVFEPYLGLLPPDHIKQSFKVGG